MSEDRITQRTVTVVMAVIALLAFVFSFGNVWNLALRLGVPDPVAPLIAPMVDLSVLGLLVALRYLSLRGVAADDLKGANRLMHTSGFFTLALNIAEPVIAGHYGRACVDAVAPVLLSLCRIRPPRWPRLCWTPPARLPTPTAPLPASPSRCRNSRPVSASASPWPPPHTRH
ncbi:DUF2637 domain-containing protein [Streptomyces sp. HMX112]|uniref:DUF2637 domain-containing protein n=1 Tax=Streptomyces sp. HMX112 TaxID=3390850 RepID=UPI003A7FB1CA